MSGSPALATSGRDSPQQAEGGWNYLAHGALALGCQSEVPDHAKDR